MQKTKFLQSCIGVSIVLLSLGFFFQSIQTASASPSPEKFFQSGTNKIGKYQMQFEGATMYVWDTETGTSCAYYVMDGAWKKYSSSKQPPANPMSN